MLKSLYFFIITHKEEILLLSHYKIPNDTKIYCSNHTKLSLLFSVFCDIFCALTGRMLYCMDKSIGTSYRSAITDLNNNAFKYKDFEVI